MLANSDSSLLLWLYRGARELPTDKVQQYAIQLVRPILRSESMVWGAGYLSESFDPAALAYCKAINRADKVIPTTLKVPWTTLNFHVPTLFAGNAGMREYTRRFRRENNLCTALADPGAPILEWCSFYRPEADDRYTEVDRERCQMLVRHPSEAPKVNQMAQDSGAVFAGKRDRGASVPVVVALARGARARAIAVLHRELTKTLPMRTAAASVPAAPVSTSTLAPSAPLGGFIDVAAGGGHFAVRLLRGTCRPRSLQAPAGRAGHPTQSLKVIPCASLLPTAVSDACSQVSPGTSLAWPAFPRPLRIKSSPGPNAAPTSSSAAISRASLPSPRG